MRHRRRARKAFDKEKEVCNNIEKCKDVYERCTSLHFFQTIFFKPFFETAPFRKRKIATFDGTVLSIYWWSGRQSTQIYIIK